MSEQPVLTVPEACARARAGRTTLYWAIRRGELVARRRGAKTLIFTEDLDRWIASHPVVQPKFRR